MPGLALHLFGYPTVTLDGAPVDMRRRKEFALLAYLATTQRAHSRDALADLFWPGYDQTSARGNLRRTLSNLNSSLGGDRLDADRDQVSLSQQDGLWVDVAAFHAHLAQCAVHGHGKDQVCPDCLAPLRQAVSLYADDFLAGFSLVDAPEFEVWQVHQAESLRREYAGALQRLAQCCAEGGDYAEAIPLARRWLRLDPLHEPAQRLLMRLHALSGDRAAALRQYDECVQLLSSELGVQPEPETTALYEQIRSGQLAAQPRIQSGAVAPAEIAAPPRHNLPEQLTPFIGRTQELEQIARRLADPHCRLLTIVGPGGIGKTRLAIEAAEQHLDQFRDGVCFVDLTAVASPDLLAPAILHAVAPDEYGDANVVRRLQERLRDKQILLVLDNFEHLLEGAEVLPGLLRSAPNLRIVITSRELLNLREEWLESLDGLEFPTTDEVGLGPSQLQAHDATRLFLGCVRRVRAGWQPTPADAAAIAGICRTLEGMPLGIELAAAWTRTLPLSEVSGELARGLSILSTSLRDVPARHRSMTAVFDQSWQMLEPDERSILRQMSVFRGGCTREAAEAVTGASLAHLTALVDSSWLRLRADGRYTLHELVRQYCEEKLATEHELATGEHPAGVRRRYCDYYAALLRSPVEKLGFRSDVIQLFAPEYGNLQAALQWASDLPHPPAIQALLRSLWFAGDMLGWQRSVYGIVTAAAEAVQVHVDGLKRDDVARRELIARLAEMRMAQIAESSQFQWLETTADHICQLESLIDEMDLGEVRDYCCAEAHYRRCILANVGGDFLTGLDQGRKALADYENENFVSLWYGREKGQAWHQADILSAIGLLHSLLGDYGEAEASFMRSIATADRIGEKRFKSQHRAQLAKLLITVGQYARAEKLALESIQESRSVGDVIWTTIAGLIYGLARYVQGDYAAAREHMLRGVDMGRQSGFSWVLESLPALARVELAEGNTVAARTYFEEMIREFGQRGAQLSRSLVMVWLGLGWTELAEGNPSEARNMFGNALSSGRCAAWEKMEGIAGLAEVAVREGRTEDAAELLALVVAYPFTAHAQRQQSKQSLDALKAQVALDVFAQRVDAGAHRSLDVTLAELLD